MSIKAAIDGGGVLVDIDERWEKGLDHHPSTHELIEAIGFIEEKNNWPLDLKFGGDGDDGETLAYILDVYFEARDGGRS